jgi:hypothetical protein
MRYKIFAVTKDILSHELGSQANLFDASMYAKGMSKFMPDRVVVIKVTDEEEGGKIVYRLRRDQESFFKNFVEVNE